MTEFSEEWPVCVFYTGTSNHPYHDVILEQQVSKLEVVVRLSLNSSFYVLWEQVVAIKYSILNLTKMEYFGFVHDQSLA